MKRELNKRKRSPLYFFFSVPINNPKKPQQYIALFLVFFCFVLQSSCKKSAEPSSSVYDPNKPVEIEKFFPDTGGIASQVIIKGKNFGSDVDDIRVYFNNKRATVLGATGDLAYVLVPRLPGDTCVVSVAIGKDSLTFDKRFLYYKKVMLSTISGTPHSPAETLDGTLVEARFSNPWYLMVDNEKNILVGEWKARARLVSEERNTVTTLLNTTAYGEVASGCTDLEKRVFYFPMNGAPYYYTFDPDNQWLARRVNPSINLGDQLDFSGKYSFAMNPKDGMIYSITTKGELIKINPDTKTIYLVKNGILADKVQGNLQTYLAFHPTEEDVLYFVNPSSMAPQDGPIPGTDIIYRMNLQQLRIETYAGTGIKGHADGEKDFAQFNNPCKIVFDKDGIMYVADTDNFCVRMITPEGIVSTIAGSPGTSGFLDGDPENSLFNRFWGMDIDNEGTLYIADYYNRAIRKIVIQ